MKKIRVLMVGPARNVKGGMTSVVNNYLDYGLQNEIELKYVESVNDKSKILKILSMIKGYIVFSFNIGKYDVIHIHIASRMSTFRKIRYIKKAKAKNKKVIIHIHGAEYKQFYDKECNEKQKKIIRDAFNMADKVIVLSEEWKEYFDTIIENKDKVVIIYNSIVVPKNFEKNLDSNKILFLGRLGKRKGIYDLVDAMERLIKEDKIEPILYVGGDGEINKVKEYVRKKELEKYIKIIGWVSGEKKEQLLCDASVYVLPSYNEGMPMSLIEGMAYKNVAISTKVGGIPKVIEDGVNGFLISPGQVEELYEKIKIVITDKELRQRLSENARKTVEDKFDIDSTIEKLLFIYNVVNK